MVLPHNTLQHFRNLPTSLSSRSPLQWSHRAHGTTTPHGPQSGWESWPSRHKLGLHMHWGKMPHWPCFGLPRTLNSTLIQKKPRSALRKRHIPPPVPNAKHIHLCATQLTSVELIQPSSAADVHEVVCVSLQDFLTSAQLYPCRMWVFTATTKFLTANTFWLEREVHVKLNSASKNQVR